ncbi:MAG TPA: hypothetical protein VHV49_00885, partial [Pseudonocardiaceae bacterium]|nr:hypothetical protein [Pseudonocardiaceae bacterium]
MAKHASSLVGFAHNWIPGNPHALSGLAGALYGYQPEIDDVTTTLNGRVGNLVHDAGWSGDAAEAFRDSWDGDSLAAQALSSVIESAGDVVDRLAVVLAKLEAGLEAAADEARRQHVPITGEGTVEPGPIPAAAAQVATEYDQLRQEYLRTATEARDQATGSLQKIYGSIAPPDAGRGGTTPSDANTLADYLRGFWAIPSAYRKTMDAQVAKLRTKAANAKAEWVKARDSRPNPHVRMPQDVKDALHDARADLKGAQQTLADAETAEKKLPFSKVLDTRLADVFAGLGKEADAAGELDTLDRFEKFAGDIPVVDVAAAGIGTFLSAKDDIEKGQPWYEAVPEDALANVGGIAAGAAVGGAVGGAIAGASFVGAPVA